MKQSRFEIVRGRDGRYCWRFVVLGRRRRQVLARSGRSYRTSRKAREAIATLLSATRVFDPYGDPVTLPATRFHVVGDAVPLIVDEFPVFDDDAEAVYEIERFDREALAEERKEREEREEREQRDAQSADAAPAPRSRRAAARRGTQTKADASKGRGSRSGRAAQ